jgi:hypothetical protein
MMSPMKIHNSVIKIIGLATFVCVISLNVCADGVENASVRVEMTIKPEFIKLCTGRSEGLFASQMFNSDIQVRLSEVSPTVTNKLKDEAVNYLAAQILEFDVPPSGEIRLVSLIMPGGKKDVPLLAVKVMRKGEFKLTVTGDVGGLIVGGQRMPIGSCITLPEKVAATSGAPQGSGLSSGGGDVYERLKKLKELKDAGILTEDEYNAKRNILVQML